MIKPKILVVDDDTSIAKLYEAALSSRGYRVKVAHSGEEALNSFERLCPDLVIMDIMMPHIHGFHVLDIIKSTPETKHTKVVMLSALSDPGSKERAKKSGAEAFMVKSEVSIGEILEKVKELVF